MSIEMHVFFHGKLPGKAALTRAMKDLDVDRRFDRSANFRWGGDEAEMVCGLCAGAALAKLVDGVFFDTEEGRLLTPDEAISMARETFKNVVKPTPIKEPGTRPTDIKRYLKPLLELRSDLV